MQKTIVTVILTALIVGGGVYYWQQQKITETNNLISQTQQPESLAQSSETPKITSPTTQQTVTSPRYTSIDKYVGLVLNPAINSQYKTNKPSEFQRAKFGGNGEEINVTPDGVSADVFVVAKNNWDVGNLEDIQTFYLEVVGPSTCWTEPNCNEPNTMNFYGPFEGKLKLLVQ